MIDANKKCKLSEFVYQNFPQISFNSLQKMLRKKDVLVNRVRIAKDVMLEKGDFVELYCIDRDVSYFKKIYEDDNIIIVNKTFGIIVSKEDKTKQNELSLQEVVEKAIHHPVISLHRLDMNTSGLVVFCKSKKVFEKMKEAMKNHEVKKFYLAEVVGDCKLENKEYVAYLNKNLKLHKSYVSNEKKEGGQEIRTTINVLKKNKNSTLVEVQISNGKTHQIRAHLSHLGYAIVGDNKYGDKTINKKFGTRKQKLLAFKIEFCVKDKSLAYLNNLEIKLDNQTIDLFFNK